MEAPVKFMAKYAAMAGIKKNHAIISIRPPQSLKFHRQKAVSMMAVIRPMVSPLREKARPGNQGNKIGVKTAPAAIALRKATTANSP